MLTPEQEEEVKAADYDFANFKLTLIYINKLAKSFTPNEQTLESLSEEEKQEKNASAATLKNSIISAYIRSKPKTMQQLKDEERIAEIARQYHKVRNEVEVEYFMLANQNGKTFVHHLFENNMPAEEIAFYLEQVKISR